MKRFVAALILFVPLAGESGLVEEWNAIFLEAVRAESTPPGLVARNLAILHLAMHDAINQKTGTYATHLSKLAPGERSGIDEKVAARSAAHRIAVQMYSSRQAGFDELWLRQGGAAENEASVRAGREIAEAILISRKGDGATTSIHYVPKEGAGEWRRTGARNRPPELPHWPRVKPFFLTAANQFRPKGPPAIDSESFRSAAEEVRRLGGRDSSGRTEEQTLIAKFWADFTYTSSPPGHWNEILTSVLAGRNCSLAETARAYALLNLVLADAGIAAFDAKYHFNHWRPITAIGSYGDQKNIDWQSLLPSPPHPEYVSAHSTFSGAAAEVLTELFGEDGIRFEVTSIDVPGVVRSYTNLRECGEEIGMSRLYGGIHFRYSNEDGLQLGRDVAQFILGKNLEPIPPVEVSANHP